MTSKIIDIKAASGYSGCTMAYGHFNTIHAGHIRYLRHARSLGKQLLVALMGDSDTNSFAFDQQERAEALSLLGIADAIVVLEENNLNRIIEECRPSVLVLGNEFEEMEEIQGTLDKQREQGGIVQFHAGEIKYASTELLTGSERDLKQEKKQVFKAVCQRQGIKMENLLSAVKEWSRSQLIVVGDTIVDQYAACEALGMSAEAPVVVVRELEKKDFIGGAAVVAAHISALGARCHLVSVVGKDSTASLVKNELREQGIGDELCIDSSRPTTFKKRYVVENQKLFRVSRLEDHDLEPSVEESVIEKLRRLAPIADGIVVSDFVYGVVTPKVLEAIHSLAEQYGLLLFGDLQCSSQVGKVTRFVDFSLLCPNEREARLALQDKEIGLEQLSQKLMHITNAERMVMKLGADGFIAYDRDRDGKVKNQQFPALSVNPVDVAGAGDSLLAVFATSLACGQPMMQTSALACCMAALAVEKMGNTPITAVSLVKNLRELLEA